MRRARPETFCNDRSWCCIPFVVFSILLLISSSAAIEVAGDSLCLHHAELAQGFAHSDPRIDRYHARGVITGIAFPVVGPLIATPISLSRLSASDVQDPELDSSACFRRALVSESRRELVRSTVRGGVIGSSIGIVMYLMLFRVAIAPAMVAIWEN